MDDSPRQFFQAVNVSKRLCFVPEGALELSAGTQRVTNTAIGDAVQFLNSSMSEPITF
jgi:hypothetical protein